MDCSVVEVEFLLGWRPGRGDGRWIGRQADPGEVGADGVGIGERGGPLHAGATASACLGVCQEDAGDQGRPGQRLARSAAVTVVAACREKRFVFCSSCSSVVMCCKNILPSYSALLNL